MAKIIAVVSGKGGTGKSTVSASLALALAASGSSVLAADLDIGLRSMDILLELENKIVFDIGDVLEKKCAVEDAMAAHSRYDRLKLLCAPVSMTKSFYIPSVTALLRKASSSFDYMILDLPAGLGLSVILARELADLVAVVTVPDIITMRDTRKTVDVILSNCKKPCRLIINKVCRETMTAGGVRDLDEVMDEVGIQLFGVVPWDPYINSRFTSLKGKESRGALTERVFAAMAERVNGRYVPILVNRA